MWENERIKNIYGFSFNFRTKLKQTEVDCDFLKRCFENLTEENRRLHKEVQELRALKLSPQFYMHMTTPPTTLTMCPSCERVAVPHSSVDVATRHHHMALAHPRPFPVGPWATAAPISHRPFDALRPRSWSSMNFVFKVWSKIWWLEEILWVTNVLIHRTFSF